MSEFAPVTTIADLNRQDDDDMRAGYYAGYHGAPEPHASVFSRAFVHGWRNGAVDGGHRAKDAAQAVLAHAFVTAQSCTDLSSGIGADSSSFRLPLQ